jgi:hypothetical protein
MFVTIGLRRILPASCVVIFAPNYTSLSPGDSRRGCGFDIGFTDHLQVVTTTNYNTVAISTLYSSLEHTLSIFHPAVSSVVVAW